jgi:hypothetical protein
MPPAELKISIDKIRGFLQSPYLLSDPNIWKSIEGYAKLARLSLEQPEKEQKHDQSNSDDCSIESPSLRSAGEI